jgi:hypothetical protein
MRPSEIVESPDGLAWRTPALGVDARWRGDPLDIRERIYADGEGSVEWRCLLPGASADTGSVSGLGYVERLRLTIAPWRLPIRSLRWGRFVSARHSLVWIDWRGDFERRLVWLDGKAVAAVGAGDDGFEIEGGARLALDCGLTIRRGPLGSTVLSAVPGLDRIAPARMLQVEEWKWRSAAILECPGEAADRGWAIHEVVRWP